MRWHIQAKCIVDSLEKHKWTTKDSIGNYAGRRREAWANTLTSPLTSSINIVGSGMAVVVIHDPSCKPCELLAYSRTWWGPSVNHITSKRQQPLAILAP